MTQDADARRPFGRPITAMVTPMRPDGSLDLDGAGEAGQPTSSTSRATTALVISGTTGESPTTTDAGEGDAAARRRRGGRRPGAGGRRRGHQRHRITRSSWPRRPRRPARTALLRRHAVLQPAAAGRPARSTSPRSPTRPALPVMLYDIPAPHRARRSPPRRMCRLAEHERIVAVKDAKGDLADDLAGSLQPDRSRLLLRRRRAHAAAARGRRRSAWSARSTHLIGAPTKEHDLAYERGDVADALRAATASCCRSFTGIFRTQGVDPGQGGAERCAGCPPGRCGRRWSTRPRRRSAQLRGRLRRGAAWRLG